MISFIKGTIVDIDVDKVVIETNNIGYNIFVPASYTTMVGKTGTNVKLYTYMSVKEDSISLFGFHSKEELNIFKKMITVSGIGPKGALAILSTLTVDKLKLAIMSEDSKAIAKSPGIGAKTASKLILELKDKIDLNDIYSSSDIVSITDSNDNSANTLIKKDATDALIALGYSPSEALNAIEKVADNVDNVSNLIKLALKEIG